MLKSDLFLVVFTIYQSCFTLFVFIVCKMISQKSAHRYSEYIKELDLGYFCYYQFYADQFRKFFQREKLLDG